MPVAHMQRISAGNCAVKAVCIRLSLLAADVLRCGMPSKSASASMPAQATAAGYAAVLACSKILSCCSLAGHNCAELSGCSERRPAGSTLCCGLHPTQ